MKVGSLFAGIGGFDLGFEWAGMETSWFVEIDPFCQHVLAQHWPGVPCYSDIRALRGEEVEPVDLLCGGFPCQDISTAGRGAGIEGERSALWFEFERLIGELRPRYVVVENVDKLRTRGLGVVLAGLSALGYDAEWDVVRASDVGAPHRRARMWIVAYPQRLKLREQPGRCSRAHGPGAAQPVFAGEDRSLADGVGQRPQRAQPEPPPRRPRPSNGCAVVADAERDGELQPSGRVFPFWGRLGDGRPSPSPWAVEPNVGRVAHGVPARVDRLRSLGNALVPQIPFWIGSQILAYEASVA